VIDNISGVRRRGTGWIVRWQEDGAGRSFTSKDRGQVEQKRAELLQQTATSTGNSILASLPDPGTLRSLASWTAAIEETARAAHRALVTGDMGTLVHLRRFQTMLVELSAAWARNSTYGELELELVRLVEYIEELHIGRRTVEQAPELVAHAREELQRRGLEPPAPVPAEPAGPRPMMRSLVHTLRNRRDPTEAN